MLYGVKALINLQVFPIHKVYSFPGGSDGKESACNAGDLGSIFGSGKSPGEGNDNPLQYLAWRISWTAEPGGLLSMGSQRIDTTEQLTLNLNNLRSLYINDILPT